MIRGHLIETPVHQLAGGLEQLAESAWAMGAADEEHDSG